MGGRQARLSLWESTASIQIPPVASQTLGMCFVDPLFGFIAFFAYKTQLLLPVLHLLPFWCAPSLGDFLAAGPGLIKKAKKTTNAIKAVFYNQKS